MTLFGSDLPRPTASDAILYLLGPSVGECAVLALPDGRCVVVDVCENKGINYPVKLLDHLGAKTIDLLVITHPDLDHVRGLAALTRAKPPNDVWRYPLEASIRDFVVGWAKTRGKMQVEADLAAITSLLGDEKSDVATAAYSNLEWPHIAGAYKLRALAPTEYDKERAWRVLGKLLTRDKQAIHKWLDKVATGAHRSQRPNVVSVAVLFELGAHKVLLSKDVLTGASSPKSGWKGILRLLRKHGRETWFQDLAAVKLAHHGSKSGFEPTCWALHARSSKTIAFAAPYAPSAIPDAQTVQNLRPFARTLLLTAPHQHLAAHAQSAGWNPMTGKVLSQTQAPLVALQLSPSKGVVEWFQSQKACAFA